jgi:Zn finger protein HypA/HybF involved in hydrogenase expression
MNNELYCFYGCGELAKFTLKNKKPCCNKTSSKCKAIREKNSNSLKQAYKEGKKNCVFTDSHRQCTINEKKAKVLADLNTSGTYRSNCYLNRIIKEFNLIEYKCSECKIEHWNNKKITLELDHIDGDSANCKLLNLRYLCPNCHSQTTTYKGKNLNTGKIKISDEELMNSLNQHKNTRQALIEVGLSPRGGNYARVARLLTKKE